MNEKSLFVSIAALVIVAASAFGFGYYFSKPSAGTDVPPLGAITVPSVSTTTHGTALQSSLLFQWQSNVVSSLSDIRENAAALLTTSSIVSAPDFTTGTMATTTHTWLSADAGALVGAGSWCEARVSSGTTQISQTGAMHTCNVINSSTYVISWNVPTPGVTSTAEVRYNLEVNALPDAQFTAPQAINVTTTTTPYNQ